MQQQAAIKPRTMGPVLAGTLICSDLVSVVEAYQTYLDMVVTEYGQLTEAQAIGWSMPALIGCDTCLLTSPTAISWLRLIQIPECAVASPLSSFGWMSLEVLVADVALVAERLLCAEQSPFKLIGKPAKLDVSPDIEACQFIGPAGEVLYLTSVAKPVPPFELPQTEAYIDRLFIPVLAVPDRATAIDFYQQLSGSKALAFDTKVTVVNRALGVDVDRRLPVATVQLNGNSLIEIDQIDAFLPRSIMPNGLVNGVAMVSFIVPSLNAVPFKPLGPVYTLDDGFYLGRPAALFRGSAGELVELIEQ